MNSSNQQRTPPGGPLPDSTSWQSILANIFQSFAGRQTPGAQTPPPPGVPVMSRESSPLIAQTLPNPTRQESVGSNISQSLARRQTPGTGSSPAGPMLSGGNLAILQSKELSVGNPPILQGLPGNAPFPQGYTVSGGRSPVLAQAPYSSPPAPASPDFEGGTYARDAIVSWLGALLRDQERYRALLTLRGHRAQALVDMFQELLDSLDSSATAFRKELVVTLQKFANEVYPTSYQVEGEVTPELEHYVGSGRFGDTYRCNLRGHLMRAKMIKVSSVSMGEWFLKHFKKEAILWAQLSHRNIVPFQGFFYRSNRPCLLSPWMSNGHINNYLGNNPFPNRYLLVKDITEGLRYLHSWGILHGNLKGANVLVDNSGRARLTDFGISSVFDTALPHGTSQSTVASKGGSARWQAPELLTEDEDVRNTVPTDVYAWGCVCYEIFTGKLPFHEIPRDITVIARSIRDGLRPTRPPAGDQAWLSWGLWEQFWGLIERCWVEDPSERPSVEELLSASLVAEALDNRPMNPALDSFPRYRLTGRAKTKLPTVEELERLVSSHEI